MVWPFSDVANITILISANKNILLRCKVGPTLRTPSKQLSAPLFSTNETMKHFATVISLIKDDSLQSLHKALSRIMTKGSFTEAPSRGEALTQPQASGKRKRQPIGIDFTRKRRGFSNVTLPSQHVGKVFVLSRVTLTFINYWTDFLWQRKMTTLSGKADVLFVCICVFKSVLWHLIESFPS